MPNADATPFVRPILELQEEIARFVVDSCERTDASQLSAINTDDSQDDTIYEIDRLSEERLVEICTEKLCAIDGPIVLIAEGLEGAETILPRSASNDDAKWRLIVDPIDGTRGLMYQKRSAWILCGLAPNRGPQTSLSDLVFAAQTEIPLVKQHLFDRAWAKRGQGASAERVNRLDRTVTPFELRPSRAKTIAHGFASVARFFPGARDELAAIDEEIVQGALGPVQRGKAHCFEDQYISSGGQLYELMSGKDRFIADLRPKLEKLLAKRGLELGICSHPYDLCTTLIAEECGVQVTTPDGKALDARLDCSTEVAWVGYANALIRSEIEPLLREALERRGLLE